MRPSIRSRRGRPAFASTRSSAACLADVAWRLQPDEVARLLTPAVEVLGDPAERRRLPFTSSHFPEPLEVEGIDVEGHVLWGMTLRLLDDLVPRLLAGEWRV